MNILKNLSPEEYKEFRSLVITMVLATDMSHHFQQINTIKGYASLGISSCSDRCSERMHYEPTDEPTDGHPRDAIGRI